MTETLYYQYAFPPAAAGGKPGSITALVCRFLLVSIVLPAMAAVFFVVPALALNESGGVITYDGDYIIHTFTSSGTLVPALGVTGVEVLVVGGGGGGGGGNGNNRAGGGGGAGGVIYNAAYAVGASVSVTVGAGGAGGANNATGTSGGDSVFDTLTAVGGGAGGGAGISGSPGGSGGGGGATNSTAVFSGGAGTAGQGNNGGYGQNRRGGGGGGAGSAGGNPVGTTGGAGGAGTTNTLFSLGPSFAGGGGGGASGTGYTGGSASGGGGAGGNDNAAGSPGTANTGGGGGGGSTSGGSGGSGIVIVRYLAPTMAIEVYNDVSLAIGPGISVPGEWQDTATDSTATMDWVSVVEPPSTANKITARITGGTLPTGLQLSVERPSGGESITLSDTDQDFITNIGNESQTGQVLTYTLTVTDCATLFVTTKTLTIEYTITAQP